MATYTYGHWLSDEDIARSGQLVAPAYNANWLTQIVPQLEAALEARLNRPFRYAEGVVEWPTVSGDPYLALELTPVASIEEIRFDPQGGYGQIEDSFGDETILTAGTDYYLKLDGRGDFVGMSMTGFVVRRSRSWGFSKNWQQGLLAASREEAIGTVKVTYTGGYTAETFPPDLRLGLEKALAILRQTLPFVNPVSSEMVGGYNYSKSQIDLSAHEFAEVRQLIDRYRRRRVGGGTSVG